MTQTLPPCPECAADLTYEHGAALVCPLCGHEWSSVAASDDDAGGGGSIKVGTKVRNIRLIDGVGDHDLDCKVDGFGPMQLKSIVVRKA